MSDKFVLITAGYEDSKNPGLVRVTPSCYDAIYALKRKTGMPMSRILEQCVDFALAHMVEESGVE